MHSGVRPCVQTCDTDDDTTCSMHFDTISCPGAIYDACCSFRHFLGLCLHWAWVSACSLCIQFPLTACLVLRFLLDYCWSVGTVFSTWVGLWVSAAAGHLGATPFCLWVFCHLPAAGCLLEHSGWVGALGAFLHLTRRFLHLSVLSLPFYEFSHTGLVF